MSSFKRVAIEPGRIRASMKGQDVEGGLLSFDSNWKGLPGTVAQGTIQTPNLLTPITVPYGIDLGYFPTVIFREVIDKGAVKTLSARTLNNYFYSADKDIGIGTQKIRGDVYTQNSGIDVYTNRFVISAGRPIQMTAWFGRTNNGTDGSAFHPRHNQPFIFKYLVLDIPSFIGI